MEPKFNPSKPVSEKPKTKLDFLEKVDFEYAPMLLPVSSFPEDSFHYGESVKFKDGLEYGVVYKEKFKYLSGPQGDQYGYGFATEEYDYAFTQLNEKDKDFLFKRIADFFETLYKNNPEIKTINSSPSDSEFSAKDIERCASEIVDELEKRPELMNEDSDFYAGLGRNWEDVRRKLVNLNRANLFFEYEKIFGREFEFENSLDVRGSPAKNRYELFQKVWAKYLKNWHTQKVEGMHASYKIIRN